ncbi:hypothetical protein DFP73DRAFT_285988 [Morchella snyderi]|nr:hypothetical protein DFP73DRAFT_285988 [Morchella snyderi]
MDSGNDKIRNQIIHLDRQIADLQRQAAELKQMVDSEGEQRDPLLNVQREHRPSAPHPAAHPEYCNCRCRNPASVPNIVGRGVHLGLVRAGDVADLGEPALKELDDGLKAIALHLVPRGVGAPSGTHIEGPFPRARQEVIALLNKVSLRFDPVPAQATPHFNAFRNPVRGRFLRMADARQGHQGLTPEGFRPNALYFETFLQLVQFRGIDLEALP